MNTLTQDQIQDVIDWMNTWDQLKDTTIPLRFKEYWMKKLNLVGITGRSNMIPEYIFYDKELSDIIRDIVKTSACDFEQAVRLLSKSKDHARDSELIKKLINCGMNEQRVGVFISAINTD